MTKSFFTVILIYLFHSTLLFGQQLLFHELEEVNLPSSECYNIIQDTKGYLWIATEEGFCRYSKKSLVVFDKKNGLPEKAVYTSVIDREGTLWIGTSDKRILYYHNSGFKEAPFQKSYEAFKKTGNKLSNLFALRIDNRGKMYISEYVHTYVVDLMSGKIVQLQRPGKRVIRFLRRDGTSLIPGGLELDYGKKQQIIIENENKTRISLPPLYMANNASQLVSSCKAGSYDFISVHENLIRIAPGGKHDIFKFPSRILMTKTDRDGGLWVGIQKGGIYYYPDPSNLKKRFHSLDRFSVTGMCEDNEHIVWCTTLEKGVFQCLNKHIAGFPDVEGLNRKGSLLKALGNKVYYSSSGTSLQVLSGGSYKEYFVDDFFFTEYLDIIEYENNLLLTGKSTSFRLRKNPGKNENIVQNRVGSWGYRLLNMNGKVYTVCFGMPGLLSGEEFTRMYSYVFTGLGRCFTPLSSNELLIGGKKFLIIIRTDKELLTEIRNVTVEITDILTTRSGDILISTRDEGLYTFDRSSHSLKRAGLKLPTDVLYDLYEDINGTIWVGSNAGLIRLDNYAKKVRPVVLTTAQGLPSNTISKITSDNTSLYFSCYEGLFFFPLRAEITAIYPPEPLLIGVDVNRKAVHLRPGKLSLSHEQNNLKFKFDFTAFRDGSSLLYDLKSKSDNSQQAVNGREFLLSNLSPGDYTLEVRVKNTDGYLTQKPWKLQISISPPFWVTGWFIFICAVAGILLTLLIASVIIRRIRRKERFLTETNKLLAEHQMSALQAQMNPHFIFNAINTIQGYIIAQNKDEAYNYLTRFSKLIRMVLHHSEEKNVPLENELEMLKIYIELEQLRFDHCFDYVLGIDPDVELHEAVIPSMVIQPFVENAIWHGIINLKKSRQGILTIRIRQEGDLLFIVIEDNGVGRKTAAGFSKPGHKSVGLSVTRQRVEMLNTIFGHDSASLLITDLYAPSGEATGTRVEIKLPVL